MAGRKKNVAESPIQDVFEGRHPSASEKEWAEKTLGPALEKSPEKPIGAATGTNLDEHGNARFTTISNVPIRRLYTQADLPEDWDYEKYLSHPGEPPYTRGIHASGYRGKLWTMRQFSGFATAEETNKRYKYLLANGQTGLSVAFDMPTLMGQDSDAPTSRGEIGHCGVAIDSLADMETLFDGIPLGEITTSMTINSPAAILLCMYIAVAEKQGVPASALGGTLQNDILKEFIAQKEFIFPPEPSMRLVVDSIEYCAQEVPKWNTISISGYHIREAGSTAAQELAFTLADGMAYVDACIERGMRIDDFASRLSFFFDAHIDFFEEIAKFRAARRIWARWMRDRYGAQDERSLKLRFHTQTAGVSLTAQQPELNIARTAIEALAAVLGGSYFVEALTDEIERQAEVYFKRIEELGGVIPAIEASFFQKEIADSAFKYQQELEQKRRLMVGVNEFTVDDEEPMEILRIDPKLEGEQVARVQNVRRTRDQARCTKALAALRKAAAGTDNLMPHILEAVRAYATEGEIMNTLIEVFGIYTEKAVI